MSARAQQVALRRLFEACGHGLTRDEIKALVPPCSTTALDNELADMVIERQLRFDAVRSLYIPTGWPHAN